MPRLFPILGRSSKEARAYAGQYAEGYDAPQGYHNSYGFEEQEPQSSAWRKVFPKKSSKRNYLTRRLQDEAAFARGRAYRTTVEDYPEEQASRQFRGPIPTDDTESFEELLTNPHRGDDIVPLIQRESSLARIGQAFEDHGTYAPALSAVPSASHPHGVPPGPIYAPQPVPGQPHMAAVHDMHGPAIVHNMVPPRNNSVRPDIVHHSSSYPERAQPHHRHRERDRSAPPRMKPSRDHHPAYWEQPLDRGEEPPVVVVVEHGKNGKKDKYYIIPGGAPVIFEDENGNELTRVGDFSGHYRPRPRPVIVQDQYGREICRAGFNNDDHISMGSRSLDGYSYHSESGRSHHRGRSSHRHESREHGSHHGSSHSSSRPFTAPAANSYLRDPHYQPSRRAGTRPSHDDLRDYAVDPRPPRSERSAGHSSSDTLVRSLSPRRDDRHGRSRGHDRRDYGSDDRGHSYHREQDRRRNGDSSGSSNDSYDRSYQRRYDRDDFD